MLCIHATERHDRSILAQLPQLLAIVRNAAVKGQHRKVTLPGLVKTLRKFSDFRIAHILEALCGPELIAGAEQVGV